MPVFQTLCTWSILELAENDYCTVKIGLSVATLREKSLQRMSTVDPLE